MGIWSLSLESDDTESETYPKSLRISQTPGMLWTQEPHIVYMGVSAYIFVTSESAGMLPKSGHLHSGMSDLHRYVKTRPSSLYFLSRRITGVWQYFQLHSHPSFFFSCFTASIFSSLPYDLIEFLAVSDNSIYLIHLEPKFYFCLWYLERMQKAKTS